MVKAARDAIEPLVKQGKTEAEVLALDPLKELNKTWAPNETAATNMTKEVYHSFWRS
jgi:hypothetical protein